MFLICLGRTIKANCIAPDIVNDEEECDYDRRLRDGFVDVNPSCSQFV